MDVPRIVRLTGSLAEAAPVEGASLYELVRVGDAGLLGEVVRVDGRRATLQVYEETTGLRLGEPVRFTGAPLTVWLGPGLVGAVLDGVGRPLDRLARDAGAFVRPGAGGVVPDEGGPWPFEPAVAPGDPVAPGDVVGTLEERPGLTHRVLVPSGVAGVVAEAPEGPRGPRDAAVLLEDGTPVPMGHAWPLRRPRPLARRLPEERPLLTGQRVLDFLFPVAEGGSVAVPGGFGTGKTVVEQSLARHADADLVVFVGCGERGNEIAEVLAEFPRLEDPRTGRALLDRTVFVVNTSNMPIAAREASIYLGVTVAEYYRDMGHRVLVLADSVSRWAEALREMGTRLQEMPGEEGYPTYLGDRLGKLYERAGRGVAVGRPERVGSVTLVAAVSPPAGDFSEPVTQAALRVTGAAWTLDAALAHQRHFPAVAWETSYTLYAEAVDPWLREHAGDDWPELRRASLDLLQRDLELREIAALVGPDALQDRERFELRVARLLREAVLGQSAFDPNDAASPLAKTHALAAAVHALRRRGLDALEAGASLDALPVEDALRAITALRDAPAAEAEARGVDIAAALAGLERAGEEGGPPAEEAPDVAEGPPEQRAPGDEDARDEEVPATGEAPHDGEAPVVEAAPAEVASPTGGAPPAEELRPGEGRPSAEAAR